jgi:hypothetical protein
VVNALNNGFFGSLDENEGEILHAHELWETALFNALDWLLAEVTITVEGSECRVSELLLEGGPRFSAQQRQWIERLAATPLRLYEVAEASDSIGGFVHYHRSVPDHRRSRLTSAEQALVRRQGREPNRS